MTAEGSIALPWEELFRPFLNYLTFGIDITIAVVIAISIIRGFIMYIIADYLVHFSLCIF